MKARKAEGRSRAHRTTEKPSQRPRYIAPWVSRGPGLDSEEIEHIAAGGFVPVGVSWDA
jgi:hypothetical protein